MAAPGKNYSNYAGWLIKIGDPQNGYIIQTDRFIRADSYKAAAYMQDVDPWTDADGYVHRNAVKLKALRVDFETPAMLTDEDLAEFLYNISKNLIPSGRELVNPDKTFDYEGANECYITAFSPRYNRYFTQKGYFADIDPQIYGNYEDSGKILRYDPIPITFVGGVYNG